MLSTALQFMWLDSYYYELVVAYKIAPTILERNQPPPSIGVHYLFSDPHVL